MHYNDEPRTVDLELGMVKGNGFLQKESAKAFQELIDSCIDIDLNVNRVIIGSI